MSFYHYLAGSWDTSYVKSLNTGVVTDVVFGGVFRVGKVQAGELLLVSFSVECCVPPDYSDRFRSWLNGHLNWVVYVGALSNETSESD